MPFFNQSPVSFVSEFGTVTFNDLGSSDKPNGSTEAWVDVATGLGATAPLVVISSQKANGDGTTIPGKFYRKGQNYTIEGMVATTSELNTEISWDSIVGDAFPENSDIQMIHSGPIPKFITVRVISPVEITQMNPQGFRFRVELLAPDPNKYDYLNTLTGLAGIAGISTGGMTFPLVFPLIFNTATGGEGNEVTVVNIGTAPAPWVATITGPLDSGWYLENATTGEYVSFDISFTGSLVLNSGTQEATLNGSPINGLIAGDWFSLVRGVNVIRLYGNYNATANFSLLARSAWR